MKKIYILLVIITATFACKKNTNSSSNSNPTSNNCFISKISMIDTMYINSNAVAEKSQLVFTNDGNKYISATISGDSISSGIMNFIYSGTTLQKVNYVYDNVITGYDEFTYDLSGNTVTAYNTTILPAQGFAGDITKRYFTYEGDKLKTIIYADQDSATKPFYTSDSVIFTYNANGELSAIDDYNYGSISNYNSHQYTLETYLNFTYSSCSSAVSTDAMGLFIMYNTESVEWLAKSCTSFDIQSSGTFHVDLPITCNSNGKIVKQGNTTYEYDGSCK